MPDLNAEIDDLLAKLIAGEASTEEAGEVEDWLDESADNRRYFAALQNIWQHAETANVKTAYPIDTEAALQKIKSKIEKRQPVRHLSVWAVPAAAVLAAVLIAYLFVFTPTPIPAVHFASTDAVRTDTLRDGSVVALNRNSSLTQLADFGRKERRTRLHGEAHFEVMPDAQKPFIIEVERLEIRVVGTEFTVDNSNMPGETVVSVKSGTVELRAGKQTERLTAGQQASYNTATGQIGVVEAAGLNVDAWRSLDFRFEATPLSEVVRVLEAGYGIKIVLKNKALANCTLTGHYPRESPEHVLDLIAETFSLTLTREGNQFVLDGPSCVE